MTPGWLPSDGLLGNVDGRPLEFVTAWRHAFMEGRVAGQAPRGFAQFNFVKENARPHRVKDAVESLHRAVELL